MIEKVKRIIDQLQDDPDLTRMMGSHSNNLYEFHTGPSGPELIDIDEIAGLDHPEIETPQVGSSKGVST
jgi:hypothetical protein